MIDATEAERIGYPESAVANGQFATELASFVDELAHGPTRTAAWKLAVNRAVLLEFDSYVTNAAWLISPPDTDHAEGRTSFREKRPAVYAGR